MNHQANPPQSPAPAEPDFRRVRNLVMAFVAVICAIVVLDNATYKWFSGSSIRGFDYLVLGIAAGYLVMLLVARPLAGKLAGSLAALFITIMAVELAMTGWSAMNSRAFAWYIWPPDYRCKIEPHGLPGVSPEGVFSTNSRGLRGPEFSQTDNARLLCIGGSTTECLYLDDAKTWPRKLANILNEHRPGVWVGNGGRSGTLVVDHVTALANLPEAKQVDCWVVLAGINDMGNQLRRSYDQAVRRTWSRTFAYRRPGLLSRPRRPLQRNLFLFELLENVRDRIKLAMKGEDFTAFQDRKATWIHELRQRRAQGRKIDKLPPMDGYLAEYEQQLIRLIALARHHDKQLVLITQPTLWQQAMPDELEDLTLAGELDQGEFLSTARRAEAMAMYNQRMIDVARREQVLCVDMADRLPKSTETFYDDCHFNEPGAQAFAEHLAQRLIDHGTIEPANRQTP
jgi:lysophospholipase L1-like esterase